MQKWIKQAALKSEDFLFPSRLHYSPHVGTRQYARILGSWVDELGLDPADYGTHSMRRTTRSLKLGRGGLPPFQRWASGCAIRRAASWNGGELTLPAYSVEKLDFAVSRK